MVNVNVECFAFELFWNIYPTDYFVPSDFLYQDTIIAQ